MKRILFSLFTILTINIVPLCAQQFRHINLEKGLSSRQVYNVRQDSKGFIWIATRLGIDRYDGKTVKNYTFEEELEEKYPIGIRKIEQDNDLSLWIYTDRSSIYAYNYSSDKFELKHKLEEFNKGNAFPINEICFDIDNRMWVASKKGLFLIHGKKITQFENDLLLNQEIKALEFIDQEKLIIATSQKLLLMNTTNHELSSLLENDTSTIPQNTIFQTLYYQKESKQIWIGTFGDGVLCFDTTKNQIHSIKVKVPNGNAPIRDFLPLNSTTMLVGTDGLGIWLVDQNKYEIKSVINEDEDGIRSLNGNGVYDIFRDKDKRLWISTYTGGVSILDTSLLKFNTLKHEIHNKNSLINNIVNSILEDSSGNIWFATNNGVSCWNKANNRWKHFLANNKNRKYVILAMCEDANRNIWLGTFSSGAFVIDKDKGLIAHHTHEAGKSNCIGTNYIFSLFKDSNNNIWIGGKNGLLSKYDHVKKSFTLIPLTQVNSIIQKNKEEILCGSNKGLYSINIKTNDTTAIEVTKIKEIRSNFIHDMLMENDSILWLSTYGKGLNRYSFVSQKLKTFSTSEGLPSNHVYSIQKDKMGQFWLSTENGISCMDPKKQSFTNYQSSHGLLEERFNQIACYRTQSDELYFGSYKGILYTNPRKTTVPTPNAKLVFLDFKLFNKRMLPVIEDSPLQNQIDDTKAIRLSHNQHSFSFHFTSVNFFNSGDINYMWKLEGFDKEWTEPSKVKTANYTNLPPGNYSFKLKAVGNKKEIILDSREMSIRIDKAFWQTTLALSFFALLFLLFCYWVYVYISERIHQKQSKEKIQFFINAAHDLRTPLTLISAPLQEIGKEEDLSDHGKYLLDIVVSNTRKLNNWVTQLLDFQKSSLKKDQLIVSENNFTELVREKIIFWQPVAKQKNISLKLNSTTPTILEFFNRGNMDKILDNLISNALKYTLPTGKVDITIGQDETNWYFEVKDNGIGISRSDQKNLFKRFFRAENAVNSKETGSGIGLILVKNYVHLHQGDISFKSIPNKETRFKLTIPRGNKHFKDIEIQENKEEATTKRDPLASSNQSSTKKNKLLIVEDNSELREFMYISLNKEYHVKEASNGVEALECLSKFNPDLVISDINMAEMNGLQLCEKLKSDFKFSHIPVILLTELSSKSNVIAGLNMGADDYIPKPFDLEILKAKIENIIFNRKNFKRKFIEDKDIVSSKEGSINEKDQEFLEQVQKIIEHHIMDVDFSVTTLTREIGVSRTVLYNKFSTFFDCTPNEFMKIARLKKAVSLLKEKRHNINEIADLTGFSDAKYFSACFKKYYGKTPTKYFEDDLPSNS